jgi:CheY-like chemotaxis protein
VTAFNRLNSLEQYSKAPEKLSRIATPREFIRHFQLGSFDLILLDLAMPEMDGFDTLEHIREVNPSVPVAALTAYAYAAEQARALHAGFCDYFIKRLLDIESFRETVYSLINFANPSYDSVKQEPAA